jgi:hypothetical protein
MAGGAEVSLSDMGIDALKWEESFVEQFRDNPAAVLENGVMLSWFANAIMAGYDQARRRYEMTNRHDMLMNMIDGIAEAEDKPFQPSGLKGEMECPRDHSDAEEYPCHICGADV